MNRVGLESARIATNLNAKISFSNSTDFVKNPSDPYAPDHPPVHGLCIGHALRNCGCSKKEARKETVSWARVPTQLSANYALEKLEKVMKKDQLGQLTSRESEVSFRHYMSMGVISNRGQVTTNPSEQYNSVDKKGEKIRSMPLTEGVLQYLKDMSKQISMCNLRVIADMKDGKQVESYCGYEMATMMYV